MIERDFNFEILPSEAATDGFVFGIGSDVSLDEDGFAPGSTDWATQDSESPQSGVTSFGRDRLRGPSWAWQVHVNRNTVAEARQTLGAFRTAWHALHIRDTPGAVLPLRYKLEGGNVRRIYGRPRRFEAPMDNRILSGYVPVSIDFKCVDGFTYDDVETTTTLGLGVEFAEDGVDDGGGFIFPLTLPVTTLRPTQRQEKLLVGGDAPAQPVVRFNGPVVNPGLETDDWVIRLNMTIPAGQYVEVDTRAWKMTALLNGTASVGGALGRRTRMHKIVFNPGLFEAKYTGFSSSGSTCQIRWASTWNSV